MQQKHEDLCSNPWHPCKMKAGPGCVCTCNLGTVGKRVGTEESLGLLVTNPQVQRRALSQRNTVTVIEYNAQCLPLAFGFSK